VGEVIMPQLGETVAEGTVSKWFKSVGDHVEKGEALFEVATDKVDTEIPAPSSGYLTAIHVPEGDTVDVGTPLATISDDLGAIAPAASEVERVRPLPAPPPPTPLEANGARRTQLSPVVRKLLSERGLDPDDVQGTGPGGRITKDDVLGSVANRPRPLSPILSPVVRRLLDEHGVDPNAVVPSGVDGRLTRHDVEAHVAQQAPPSLSGSDEIIPFTRIRRLTADHMVRSKSVSAHTLMVRELDYESVERARHHHGATFREREGHSLTYLPFVAYASARALREFPHLNASVGDDALVVHRRINLGVAVDLDGGGLVVPVIHDADQMSVLELARSIREKAVAARNATLNVDDFAGGTFTLTNPGPFGTLMTGAIINQPEVAILSTDAVTRRATVVTNERGSEAIAIHSIGLLALTFDHRAIDGAYAARFLERISTLVASFDESIL
jgi:2-oxoglutarate dehydrogenase E2 component (dihydrolipoamide succinyltransferase)